jgi:hypothetical protein
VSEPANNERFRILPLLPILPSTMIPIPAAFVDRAVGELDGTAIRLGLLLFRRLARPVEPQLAPTVTLADLADDIGYTEDAVVDAITQLRRAGVFDVGGIPESASDAQVIDFRTRRPVEAPAPIRPPQRKRAKRPA